jgi:hypothetical protein
MPCKMTMRVHWFFGMEDALIQNGTTRTSLAFGFVGDLIAGQKPLVLQALAVWRREDRLLGVSRNGLQRRVSAVRNILFSDIFPSWKSATPGGFPSRVIPLRSRQCAGKTA